MRGYEVEAIAICILYIAIYTFQKLVRTKEMSATLKVHDFMAFTDYDSYQMYLTNDSASS